MQKNQTSQALKRHIWDEEASKGRYEPTNYAADGFPTSALAYSSEQGMYVGEESSDPIFGRFRVLALLDILPYGQRDYIIIPVDAAQDREA